MDFSLFFDRVQLNMDQPKPILITNFKSYAESRGASALRLLKIHEQVAEEFHVEVMAAVHVTDLVQLAKMTSLPLLAQHVDGVGYGAYTGQIPPVFLKEIGIKGSLINHSERRLEDEVLEASLKRLKEESLLSVVCAETSQEASEYATLGADFVAVEPPELIGGDASVSTTRPELIAEAVERLGREKVLVGAGIKTEEDVRIARQLGARGILVASGIVKANDPLEALRSLCRGLTQFE